MANPAVRCATYEDVLTSPDHCVAEILDGELVLSPRPAMPQAVATSVISGELGPPFRRERMARVPANAFLTLAPDWVCEVLSPRTAKLDRSRKLPLYAHYGVRHAWLVDPTLHTLEVLAVDEQGHWTTLAVYTDSEVVRAVPFDAIEFDVALLWADVEQVSE